MKGPLIFKLDKGTPVRDFFLKQNLEKSPWNDLTAKTNLRGFHTQSYGCWQKLPLCRLFVAMKSFGDESEANRHCLGHYGWLMITAKNNTFCKYENKPGRRRVILYSKGDNKAEFTDDSESSKCLSNTFSFFFYSCGQKFYIRRVVV